MPYLCRKRQLELGDLQDVQKRIFNTSYGQWLKGKILPELILSTIALFFNTACNGGTIYFIFAQTKILWLTWMN
jgi:hypothetical protein